MEAIQYELTTDNDDFVREKPIWVAEMDSGIRVFQDDDRPGVSEPSAWRRIAKYIVETGDYIARLRIQFCSNMVWVKESRLGYYFARGAGLFIAASHIPVDFYSIGRMVADNHIITKQFKTPEMLYLGEATRTVEEAGERLIRNPKKS